MYIHNNDPAAVPSPQANDITFQVIGEVRVPLGVAPGGGGDNVVISLLTTEASDAEPPVRYWQRRGKTTVKQAIRRFLLLGRARWRGEIIATRHQLAQAFDSQLIATIERRRRARRFPALGR